LSLRRSGVNLSTTPPRHRHLKVSPISHPRLHSRRKGSIWKYGRAVVENLAQAAAVKFAEDGIHLAVWIVPVSGGSIGHGFVDNVQPVMTNAPPDGEQSHGPVITPCNDIDLGALAARGEDLSGEFGMRIDFFLVDNAGITEAL
jgi:hypothetical protein